MLRFATSAQVFLELDFVTLPWANLGVWVGVLLNPLAPFCPGVSAGTLAGVLVGVFVAAFSGDNLGAFALAGVCLGDFAAGVLTCVFAGNFSETFFGVLAGVNFDSSRALATEAIVFTRTTPGDEDNLFTVAGELTGVLAVEVMAAS